MAKRATTKEGAERAGDSRTTVSFVLNKLPDMRISKETRQAVLQAVPDLDYHPDATARRMVTGRTRVLDFVLSQNLDQALADLFVPTALNGFSQAASALGYKVLFEPIPPQDTDGTCTRLVTERHVDGFALSGPRFDDVEHLRAQARNAPVVIMGQLPGTNLPCVDVDNEGGAALATNHLLALGHERIALITNADLVYTASSNRLAGYRLAFEAAGLEFKPERVCYGNFTTLKRRQSRRRVTPARPAAHGRLRRLRHGGARRAAMPAAPSSARPRRPGGRGL
jgi:DNA-binding LacI/PurR family transcriptional regulator